MWEQDSNVMLQVLRLSVGSDCCDAISPSNIRGRRLRSAPDSDLGSRTIGRPLGRSILLNSTFYHSEA